jgi:hypothetical protein
LIIDYLAIIAVNTIKNGGVSFLNVHKKLIKLGAKIVLFGFLRKFINFETQQKIKWSSKENPIYINSKI